MGSGGGVCVDDFFGLRPESQVCEKDVALFAEEKTSEGEVDTWQIVSPPYTFTSSNRRIRKDAANLNLRQ